jgi:hypothetical protein
VTCVKWKIVSDCLEKCQPRRNIGAWFAPNVPWAWKSFWVHPMVLLGDVGQVEAHFDPFGDSVNLSTR